ncbi:hypothetical protein [Cohnella abietis]|nr:hypothetical protein [Cohnella abietis]
MKQPSEQSTDSTSVAQYSSHVQQQPSIAQINCEPTIAENWQTKYTDRNAIKQICKEAIYLVCLLICIPILMLLVWNGWIAQFFGLNEPFIIGFRNNALAWLGGMLGGTLFSIKWLYHSVASYTWYQDRFLWRVLTPPLSGALSFAIILLISSGFINIFDKTALSNPSTIVGLGFLSGYFSDSAIAKMTDVANTLFGTLDKKK